jgi:hypothetical protein
MKTVFTLSAVIELGAGLAFVCCPSAAAALLVGTELQAPAALTVARIGGAALVSLSIACWLARADVQSCAARGIIAAMLFYNIAAVSFIAFAGLGYGLYGILLWPGVLLHTIMAVWCLVCVLRPSLPPFTNEASS